jgi:hypothetical protein
MADQVEGIYVYVEVRPDGGEAVVGAVPGRIAFPLVTSRRASLNQLDAYARSHARTSGYRVELRRFPGPAALVRAFDPKIP